jgi:hypothetical protein
MENSIIIIIITIIEVSYYLYMVGWMIDWLIGVILICLVFLLFTWQEPCDCFLSVFVTSQWDIRHYDDYI